jgi:DNA sulfur modification protein DndD
MSSDTKIAKEAKVLETKIMELSSEITDRRAELRDKLDSLDNYTTQLDQLEVHKATAENYKNIQERLKTQEDLLLKKRGMIMSVNYNHNLLDQMWVLCAFPSVLKEFKQKCSALSKEKRIQEKDFDRQRAYEIGKLDAVKELRGVLENGTAQLPWYLPDENTMEEMINDHICKVCGREAPEGSDAYKFMVNKLETYRKHLLAETKKKEVISEMEEKELFTATHIESLHNLSISLSGSEESKLNNIVVEIHDRLELNERIGNEIKVIEQKIADIKDEKARLLIQAGNVSEQLLEKEFSDIRGLFDQKERTNMRIQELEAELTLLEAQRSDIKNQLDKLDPEGFQVKISRDVNRVLHLIAMAFSSAKKENLRRFLSDLEESANKYLVSLSANDFHGQIHFVQRANSEDSPEIRLFSSNGTEIKNPSGSQKTVMYISVLFAISEFTSMKRDEDYPLIFDAATSSFSDSKENDFYNVIDKINKQCIIVTKDFIEKGELRRTEIDKLTCSVYRIRKAQGFNKQDMATIRTIIEKVK